MYNLVLKMIAITQIIELKSHVVEAKYVCCYCKATNNVA